MTTVNRWNPVRDMIVLRDAMDRMMEDSLRNRNGAQTLSAWALPIDVFTSEDAIILQADVPGLKPEELQVTLEGDTLTIRGELKATEDRKFLLRERPTGKFERTLTINTPIDHAKVDASFENGVLTLTLPKAEAVKPRQISIKAKSIDGANAKG